MTGFELDVEPAGVALGQDTDRGDRLIVEVVRSRGWGSVLRQRKEGDVEDFLSERGGDNGTIATSWLIEPVFSIFQRTGFEVMAASGSVIAISTSDTVRSAVGSGAETGSPSMVSVILAAPREGIEEEIPAGRQIDDAGHALAGFRRVGHSHELDVVPGECIGLTVSAVGP